MNKRVFIILCEGETELNYLKLFLKSNKIQLRKAKLTNAQQLVKEATNFRVSSGFDKIYCVFDRDSSSNSRSQLENISNIFKQNTKTF